MAEDERKEEVGTTIVEATDKEDEMKPWEQHSAVISIPRFDYKASSSLLRHSHSAFLITCPIKREKSATKEAIAILEKYIVSNPDAKRRKICMEDANEECNGSEGAANEHVNSESDTSIKKSDILSLVKLTRSGLLLFTFPFGKSPAVVDIVSQIFQSLESGILKSPLWCNRILPIQGTCPLEEKELKKIVTQLVDQFIINRPKETGNTVKFAVGYNRRGIEETEMKNLRKTSSDPDVFALLDRNKCFSVVAAAVKEVVPDSTVDLKDPELSVLVEVLPLSRVPDKTAIVGVSVLPRTLVSTKPRLCIKALVSDTKEMKGKKR
ncbi:uncharacterized protein [Nicotiana sylvestris]|uniref:Uncharacterized protein LOC104232500 isoform X1 n=1 Tax=Nicotiana sylvestris TaxID=4096 RepID=A0A1U7X2Y5_NICSY|nr:PREDICTED: uncharacterized protein LOC104232500 isoform X1 [Nicotiana sylvestris]XP_016447538.1 PREDICTED: uncharacterized protein LOC107772554 isoform X1 [Nicotiana tabacum]